MVGYQPIVILSRFAGKMPEIVYTLRCSKLCIIYEALQYRLGPISNDYI